MNTRESVQATAASAHSSERSQELDLTVIIPAHNEYSRLRENVEITDRCLRELGVRYEILIAEDGSTDGTDAVADEIARTNENVRVRHSARRLGKGVALSEAFRQVWGNAVVFMDADLATDLKHVPEIVEGAKSRKVLAIGSRLAKGARVKRPLSRAIASRAYNWLVRMLFDTGVLDHQCGFKAVHRGIARDVLPRMGMYKWIWDTELIVRAKRAGYTVIELPVAWTETKDDVPLFTVLKLAPVMAYELLRLKLTLD